MPSLLANTDWVVTMPTKNQYVDVGTRHGDVPPFQRNFNGTKGACDDIALDFWDREEKKNTTPGGFSPPQPGVTAALCWEANVITFKSTGVLGSTNTNFLDVNAKGFVNGWAQLDVHLHEREARRRRHDGYPPAGRRVRATRRARQPTPACRSSVSRSRRTTTT